MAARSASFRIGRVRAFLRGRVWYLSYHENGQRRQPRVGRDREEAKRLTAEVNAQLEAGAPSALGFEPIAFPELRQRWLDHHEHVRRSSLETIRRYKTATEHLLDFLSSARPLRRVSDFRPAHAEEFVRYLRTKRVASNGHRHAHRRLLRDAGVRFVLETCSSLMNYAERRRHFPPYVENPFRTIEVCRMPIEDAAPTIAFTNEQQEALLNACDDWQFPIFLTALLTGLRPGELIHLLLPENLDLETGWLFIRNKQRLGWQIKTRNERDIPLVPVLVKVIRCMLGERNHGPLFRQRRCVNGHEPPLARRETKQLEAEVLRRCKIVGGDDADRQSRLATAKSVWRDLGALKEDWIRKEFLRVTARAGFPEITTPKTLRHTFATILQDANVDPLIRNELMGHAPMSTSMQRGLGMTAIYTHTRPETKRRQLEGALETLPVQNLAATWCARQVLDNGQG
jgi:integrase